MSSIRPLGAVPKQGLKKKAKNYKGMNEAKASKREDRLWHYFSQFIRLRDCIDGTPAFAKCISCGKPQYYKEMDAGHYVSRRWKPTKYDERNVHAQCVHCNRDLSGNVDEYARAIGDDLASELKELSRQPAKKMLLWEIESKIAEYRQKAKDEAYRIGVEIK